MADKKFTEYYKTSVIENEKAAEQQALAESEKKRKEEADAKVRAELAKIAKVNEELGKKPIEVEKEVVVEEEKPKKTARKRTPKKVEESSTDKLLKELLAERKDMQDLLSTLSEAVQSLSESVLRLEEKDWTLPAPIIEMKEPQHRPVVKEVIRDKNGNILQIVESVAKESNEDND